MSLFDGQDLVNVDNFPHDLIICRERTTDVKPVYLNTIRKVQQFLISCLSGIWIGFKILEVRPDDPPAFQIAICKKSTGIGIDANGITHASNSASDTYWFLFLIRFVSSISRFSEFFRMSSFMTSS